MGVILLPEIVETAIQAFIQDTGSNRVIESAAAQPDKKKYTRSTRIINRRNISTTTGEKVFEQEGIGVLREVTVVADQKINLQLELDGRQPFGSRSEWDDLAAITLYSETVVAKLVGSDYVLNLKLLHFKQGLSIFAWFNTQATISNILGVYDLCEEY
uniref:Uncharacterized protein n=1 Tax=viral metagenome TaxID=1070528 RepID=A0A6M3IFX4_9ZZZZ